MYVDYTRRSYILCEDYIEYMTTEKKRSSLHLEKFKKTGKARGVWDLAKMSTKSVAISTELPEDVIDLMEKNGPLMEANGLITKNTSYSIMQYCVTAKLIALDMAIRGLNAPDQSLMKFMIRRRCVRQPTERKKIIEYYKGKHTIPVSSAIPTEIAKLAEKYGPILEEKKMIESSTPYNVWKYCCAAVMTEVSRTLRG